MRANLLAYRQICTLMDTLKWVERYKNDLYQVDRDYLTGNFNVDAPESFGIVFRTNGVQLDDPRRQDDTREIKEREYIHTWGVQNCRFFWYAYGHLKEYEFTCYLMKWDEWHTFYQEHWNEQWTSYFRPQR